MLPTHIMPFSKHRSNFSQESFCKVFNFILSLLDGCWGFSIKRAMCAWRSNASSLTAPPWSLQDQLRIRLMLMWPQLLFCQHHVNHQETWINLATWISNTKTCLTEVIFSAMGTLEVAFAHRGSTPRQGKAEYLTEAAAAISSLHICSRGTESLIAGWTCGHLNCTFAFDMTALYSHISLLIKTTRIKK